MRIIAEQLNQENKGLRLAKGGFLAFIDNDDIWESNKLELQMNHFNNNPDVDVCFSYMESFLSPELVERY